MATLYDLNEELSYIEAELIENGGELTKELADKLAKTTEELKAKADNYYKLLKNFDTQIKGFGDEIKALQERKKAIENARERVKNYIAYCMTSNGISEVQGELHKFTFRKTQAIEVDELTLLDPYADMVNDLRNQLPAWLTIETKVSKTELKNCEELPAGVRKVENTSLLSK